MRVLAPEAGSTVTVGEVVAVRASVEDGDSSPPSVHYEIGGEFAAFLSGDPASGDYSGSFTAASTGSWLLSVVARDGEGNEGRHEVQFEVLASSTPTTPGLTSEPFAIVVIPDTQNMIGRRQGNNDMVREMTEWIVANRNAFNIRFATQLGDVVDYGWDLLEWERADAQLGGLDGVVPYSVALGDHDYRNEENKGSPTRNYVEFFGPGRYADYDWYGGANASGTSHFQVFSGGELEFLHVALEWEPEGPASDPTTPLGWARSVIEARQHMPTIITTHAYLWDEPGKEGRTSDRSDLEGFVEVSDGSRTYPGSTGQEIFEALVEPYPNVFMVLNGHYHRAEGTAEGEYHQVSLNSAGSEVFEMLSNYQAYPNGGDGWLRIIEFIPGGGEAAIDRIAVSTYSPVLDAYQTDEHSEFHFDLSFAERFPRD